MVKKRLSDLLREEVNKSDAKPDENQAADTPAEPAEASAQPDAQAADTPSSDKPQNSTASPKATAKKAAPKAEPAKPTPEPTPAIAPPAAEKALGEPLRLGIHPSQSIPQNTSGQDSSQGSSQDISQDSQDSQDSQETVAETNSAHGTAKRTSPTKADLEGTIAQLKTELSAAQEQSQQQETQFAEQLDRLQTEMKRQQSVIDQLQAEVQHSKSLKAELEEARQVILKLSELNSKPIDAKYSSSDGSKDASKPASQAPSQTPHQSISAPKSQTTNGTPPASNHHLYVKAGESKPIEPPSAKPARSRSGAPIVPAPTNAAEPELESKPVQFKMPGANPDAGKLAPPARHQQELRRILDHPTRPGALPPMPTPSPEDKKDDKKLSETDMGWVD